MRIKNVCVPKDTTKDLKNNSRNGRKYFQIIYLTKNLYLDYTKNSAN